MSTVVVGAETSAGEVQAALGAVSGDFYEALGAVPAVGVLRGLLVDTSPYDVPAFMLARVLLLAAIGAACLVPAVRAATVDPMIELRKD